MVSIDVSYVYAAAFSARAVPVTILLRPSAHSAVRATPRETMTAPASMCVNELSAGHNRFITFSTTLPQENMR